MRNQFYRPEIDGLRAVAVLPVVLYHAGVQSFSGGFVGVDIFFVVSGFLITQIIMRHIDEQNFSIVQFYERRARRIAPALAFVLLVTSLLASWLLLPEDLIEYARSLVATVLFSSNFLFWSETGYFAAPSEFKPLLHTWSLAVEEQFYIVYPVFLLVVCRYWRSGLISLLSFGFAASLMLSIWGTAHTPGAAFYLAPTRAWELTLGALLALNALPVINGKFTREALTFTGLLLIGCAVAGFTAETPFPGFAALAPCLGAALVIYANSAGASRLGGLLSLRPIVGIGLISYSLYLWHWPLIVFAKYYLVRSLLPIEITTVIALSFVLAFVSWRWVEQPFRKPGGVFDRKRLFSAIGACGVVFIVLGVTLQFEDGLRGRFLDSELQLLSTAKERRPERLKCLDLKPQSVLAGDLCVVGEPSNEAPVFLLWGDSHADAMMLALDKEARKMHAWGYYAFYLSCPPLLGVENVWKPPSHECRAFNEAMAKVAIDQGIENIVLVAMWANYPIGRIQEAGAGSGNEESSRFAFQSGLDRTLNTLAANGRQAWIVEQVPQARHDVPKALAVSRRFGLELDEIAPSAGRYANQQAFVHEVFDDATAHANVHRVDPSQLLCDTVSCRVMVDGRSLYADDDHLSEVGARWVSGIFRAIFDSKSNQ